MIRSGRFSKREQALALTAVIILLTAVAIQWGYDGLHRRFNQADEEIRRLAVKLAQDESLLRRQARIEAEFKAATQIFAQAQEERNGMPMILAPVHAGAQANRIQVQELNSLPDEKDDGVRTIRIKITFAGEWSSVLNFLNALQNPPERFDIDEIALERSTVENGQTIRGQVILSRWSMTP